MTFDYCPACGETLLGARRCPVCGHAIHDRRPGRPRTEDAVEGLSEGFGERLERLSEMSLTPEDTEDVFEREVPVCQDN